VSSFQYPNWLLGILLAFQTKFLLPRELIIHPEPHLLSLTMSPVLQIIPTEDEVESRATGEAVTYTQHLHTPP
jgi:hypothetical protein